MSLKQVHLTCSLLLTVLLAGCGSDKTSNTSGQQPAAPTLAGSFEGKRIHFQILPEEKEGRTEEFWLQFGENNQVSVIDHDRSMSMPYAINETKLIMEVDAAKALEIRFSNPELAVGDQVTFFQHKTEDTNLQALLNSTDDSGAKKTAPGLITKIEAAQEITAKPEPPTTRKESGTTGNGIARANVQPRTSSDTVRATVQATTSSDNVQVNPPATLRPKGAPLHEAAEENDVALIKQLLAAGININSTEGKDGETPLQRAITKNSIEAARLLVEEGADVNKPRADGETPLQMAEGRNRPEIAKLLRETGAKKD